MRFRALLANTSLEATLPEASVTAFENLYYSFSSSAFFFSFSWVFFQCALGLPEFITGRKVYFGAAAPTDIRTGVEIERQALATAITKTQLDLAFSDRLNLRWSATGRRSLQRDS